MSARSPIAPIEVRVARLPHGHGLPLPSRQSEGAAGLDLQAAIAAHAPLVIAPGARVLVPTGFAFEMPPGHEGQVRPRSGLALRHGITVLNSPGTIDADYRGEVQVLIINLGGAPFEIRRGDRVAQLVVQPFVSPRLIETSGVEETARGAGGFGSTGVAPPEKKKTVAKKAEPRKAFAQTARRPKTKDRQ